MDHVRQQFRLKRLNDEMLKARAESSNRSKNGEINAILDDLRNGKLVPGKASQQKISEGAGRGNSEDR